MQFLPATPPRRPSSPSCRALRAVLLFVDVWDALYVGSACPCAHAWVATTRARRSAQQAVPFPLPVLEARVREPRDIAALAPPYNSASQASQSAPGSREVSLSPRVGLSLTYSPGAGSRHVHTPRGSIMRALESEDAQVLLHRRAVAASLPPTAVMTRLCQGLFRVGSPRARRTSVPTWRALNARRCARIPRHRALWGARRDG